MTRILATTPGLYPLPDPAKRELADLKGHQKGDLISGSEGSEIEAAYQGARASTVDEQTDAGLDRIVEGQLRWDDMLAHPLTVNDAVDTGGIVRYYDNNNFYRDPRVTDDLTFSGDVAAELQHAADLLGDAASDSLQAVLPGPYSLADLASNEHYDDTVTFLDAVAEFLAAEVDAFPSHRTLYLLEPSYVVNPPSDGVAERASAAIDRVATATDAEVVVHTYWGAFEEKPYAHLLDAGIDAVGYDFVAADRETNRYCINEYGAPDQIALGVVDGQNTRVESSETVADRVEWIDDQTPGVDPDTVYLSPNTELFYLPTNKHRAKLDALATGAARLRDQSADAETGVRA